MTQTHRTQAHGTHRTQTGTDAKDTDTTGHRHTQRQKQTHGNTRTATDVQAHRKIATARGL